MDVCAKLRGILHDRRVGRRHLGSHGHRGTAVFVGQATRAVQVRRRWGEGVPGGCSGLGTVTDTQDVTGTVLERRLVSVTARELEEALAAFRGDILQVPPMYSARR